MNGLRIYVNQVLFLAVNMLKCNKFYSTYLSLENEASLRTIDELSG